MSRFLPPDAKSVEACSHKPPLGAIQIEPGLWYHGRDLYIYRDEFVGDRAEFVVASLFVVLRRTEGMTAEDYRDLTEAALALAAMARYSTAFPEDDVKGGGVYVCCHAAPEGVTR